MERKNRGLVRILALLTVLALLLTACGGGAANSDKPATATAASTQAAAGTAQAAGTAAAGGEKPPLELTAMLIQYATPPDQNSELWKTIEKKFNIHYKKIDWVPDADYSNKQNIVLSSGDIPDIMYTVTVADPTINKAIQGGLFADLTPVLGDFSKYPNLAKLNPAAWTTSKVNGKNYLFPRSRDNFDMPIAHIRGDWLEKLKMEVPKTVDEFANYFKSVCKADLDGNGKNDTIGITGIDLENWSSAFGPGNKLIVRPEGKSTGIVNVRLTEAYALELEYFRKLYAEGLMSSEYALLKGQQQEELFITGKSAMYVKNIWHRKRMDNELKKVDPKAYSSLVFSLKGPNGVAFNYDKGWAGGLLVSSKVSKEKLVRIVEFMNQSADKNNFNFISFGIEGQHYKMVDGFPQLTDEGKKIITLAWTYPFTYASQTYAKVDSPLADAAYNLATRKMTNDGLDSVYASYKNPLSMEVLQSKGWVSFWGQRQDEFKAFCTAVITGTKTVDEFRAYQKQLLKDPLVIQSFDELQKSYDGFGLPKQ